MGTITRYRKSLAALIGTVATWGAAAAATGGVTPAEWWGLLAALGTVVAVWGVPNDAPAGELPDPTQSERG